MGIDDAPRLLNGVLAGKQALVAAHGLAQQPFVGVHFVGLWLVRRQQFLRATDHFVAGVHDHRTQRDCDFGAQAEPNMIGNQWSVGVNVGGAA